ncbi:MAG: transcription-repair coupling factor [Firmicutes bacterium]|nr:transcription-repair coupling factor [Bacillota bacterium]
MIDIDYIGNSKEYISAGKNENVSVFLASLGVRTILANEISAQKEGRAVYVCADIFSAKQAFEQFKALSLDAVFLPHKDEVLFFRDVVAVENYSERLASLHFICNNPNAFVVTTVQALAQIFPCKNEFTNAGIILQKGKSYELENLIKRLVNAGYKRSPLAETMGHFSLRGDILDVFVMGAKNGVRLEFFGDELESIREYDITTYKSSEKLDSVDIIPATEIFYDESQADELLNKVTAELVKPTVPEYQDNYHRLISKLSIDLSANSKDIRLTVMSPLLKYDTFETFLAPTTMFIDDAKQVADMVDSIYAEHKNRIEIGVGKGEVLKCGTKQLIEQTTLWATQCPKTAFHAVDSQNRLFKIDKLFRFKGFSFPKYHRNLVSLWDDCTAWLGQKNRVILFAGSEAVANNIRDFFSENPLRDNGLGKLEILSTVLPYGAAFFEEKTILVGTHSLVSGASHKSILRRTKRDIFTEPKIGGFVVHRYHGIGFFECVTQLTVGGAKRDYALIKYAGTDKLYVPVENMDSLSHYDDGEVKPNLHKLGGGAFLRVKEKVRASVAKMAIDLSKLYADRSTAKGHAYTENNELLDQFSNSFIYTETDDQIVAIDECIADLEEGKVMDRLLCGDVGYGKTEVALRAAFKVIQGGKQVAFLAPTTILAKQHYNTCIKRMGDFGINIASLTRFDKQKDVDLGLVGLAEGMVDLVCGTHRLLSKDVAFKDLGLLILDEEQRFGVADKDKIKSLKKNVNVLTLSATPIPRTLHLSLSGIRDISVLDMPPKERLPVKTFITEFSETVLNDAICSEVGRGGQAFIVYNRVETMDSFAVSVKSILPSHIKVKNVHGQMPADKIEDTIVAFTKGEFDVLIASTLIENGIDMPNANTLVVIDADRFGLAQLYQLRGRVGRSNRLAYAYFTFDAKKVLTETAYKRLEAIGQFTEFGSGFKIAMRDLEIRGAGNVLGREQHGHIEKVGYDMYCKILTEVLEDTKDGAESREKNDVKVLTDFSAYLPEEFVEGHDARARVYTRVSQIKNLAELKKLQIELTEIYGKIPLPLENLMLVALVKNLSEKLGAITACIKKSECYIAFEKVADIPEFAIKNRLAKLDIANAKLHFGASRDNMLRFLLDM